LLQKANKSALELLSRHLRGDWGELCQEDKTQNELSLKYGFRLMRVLPPGAVCRAGIRCPTLLLGGERMMEEANLAVFALMSRFILSISYPESEITGGGKETPKTRPPLS
jgi:hypothetical protein